MCAVSNVGDNYKYQALQWYNTNPVNRSDFEVLKFQVEQMRKELEAAKLQDIKNNEPDCEMEDKVELLKKVAEKFGVDLSKVFN